MDREHAGDERDVEPAGGDTVAVAQEQLVVEEHLRDRPVGPGRDLLGEHVEVVGERGRLRVALGVGGHGDVERCPPLHRGDEIGGALVPVGVRCVRRPGSVGRVAAQGDDVLDPERGVAIDDRVDVRRSTAPRT